MKSNIALLAALISGIGLGQEVAAEPQFVELGIERHTADMLCQKKGTKVELDLITNAGKTVQVKINPRLHGGKIDTDPATIAFAQRIENPQGKLKLAEGFAVQVIFPDGRLPETFRVQKVTKVEGITVTYLRDLGDNKGRLDVK